MGLKLAMIFSLLFAVPALGEPPAAPTPGAQGHSNLGPYVEVLEDPGGELRIEEVRQDASFKPSAADTPNFGYTRSAWWLKFRIYGGTHPGGDMLLEVSFPSIDRVELYAPPGGGPALQRAGDSWPWVERAVKHRNHVFRVTVPKAPGAHDFYLRAESRGVLTVPLTLWLPAAFERHNYHAQLVLGLFYGLLAAMLLYNLMVYVWLRDRSYLYYVLYVASFTVFLLSFDGLAFEFLWPDSVWWANHGLATSIALTLAFGALFSCEFLDMRRIAPTANSLLRGIAVAGLALSLCAASGWLLDHGEILRVISVLGFGAAAIAISVAVRAFVGGLRPARFFLLAWGALLVFIALGALRNFALMPTNFVTVHGLHLGLGLDVLLLSFALADRINALKRESAAAQADNEKLRHLAQHDPLTGLPNRISMRERLALALEISKRNRKKLAVMLVDLDGFKRLNDSRGHIVGDHALTSIAARLRSSVRASDTVARYGGDEFVVLAGELARAADAAHIAEKIADMVAVPMPVDGATERVGCSIGISVYPDDARTAEELVAHADRAMYAAKSDRERRYAYFEA